MRNSAQNKSNLFALAHRAHPENLFKRIKMILLLLMLYYYHRKVVDIFNVQSLQEIPCANPRIYKKIGRSYLHNDATKAERVRLLAMHYRFISESFDSFCINSMYVKHDFTLCRFLLADGSEIISASLAYSDWFEREGELTLGVHNEVGDRLCSVSFAFQSEEGKRTALIGCIIGRYSANGKEGIITTKQMTKGLHGMRPMNLVLFLLQTVSRCLGVNTLLAVGLNTHIYGKNPRRRNRIKFNYDQFWDETGGVRSVDNKFYILPLNYVRHSYEEIPSNKRALYLRRYALLDDIEFQIRNALIQRKA